MTEEAKQEIVEEEVKTDDVIMDELLDKAEGKEKPGSSSNPEETTETDTETEDKSADDPDIAKKEDKSEEETDIPEEFHKHEAWQKLLQRAKDAESKIEELGQSSGISEEDRKLLDSVKELTTSKSFLEDKLKREGYKDEVIADKLKEAGFDVSSEKTDLDIAASALGLDVNSLGDQDRADITNLVKISNALIEAKVGKILPSVIKPLSEQVAGLTGKEAGIRLHDDFVSKVKSDGVLDFEKDLAPDIAKFLDDNEKNPDFKQEDVAKFLQDTYHAKLVQYQKAKSKKDERDETLKGNRPGGEGAAVGGKLPEKTGNFDTDADAFLDHLGVH